jgi:outer membrane protein OmpA-like peptidoglycan-associated protein
LSLGGYTDERGADKYNDSLSELRVQRVKDFLVSQGIAAEKINTAAYGKQKPLDKAAVSSLQTQNPNKPPEKRVRDSRATWLAYNRRVDIVLMPTNAESVRFYPDQAPDSQVLWQRLKPAPFLVEGDN